MRKLTIISLILVLSSCGNSPLFQKMTVTGFHTLAEEIDLTDIKSFEENIKNLNLKRR